MTSHGVRTNIPEAIAILQKDSGEVGGQYDIICLVSIGETKRLIKTSEVSPKLPKHIICAESQSLGGG